jgi:hypothetical protein
MENAMYKYKYGNKIKADKKKRWMGKFEELATSVGIYDHGKVDWDTATHLFNLNLTPEKAIERIKEQRKDKE